MHAFLYAERVFRGQRMTNPFKSTGYDDDNLREEHWANSKRKLGIINDCLKMILQLHCVYLLIGNGLNHCLKSDMELLSDNWRAPPGSKKKTKNYLRHIKNNKQEWHLFIDILQNILTFFFGRAPWAPLIIPWIAVSFLLRRSGWQHISTRFTVTILFGYHSLL